MLPNDCFVQKILNEIIAEKPPRYTQLNSHIKIGTKLPTSSLFYQEISGYTGVYFLRCLYYAIGFDENRLFHWRLEHKLIQAKILTHFLGDKIPKTLGINELLSVQNNTIENLSELCNKFNPQGYLIKSTLGHSSRGQGDGKFDLSQDLFRLCPPLIYNPNISMVDEQYIIQERVNILEEYRIHSMEGLVIPTLTSHRYSHQKGKINFEKIDEFVQSQLNKLPSSLLYQTILAWDVAKTEEGMIIIEINIVGFHPYFKRGFQCSGNFQGTQSGPDNIAMLLEHIKIYYNTHVEVVSPNIENDIEQEFFLAVKRCFHSLLSIDDDIIYVDPHRALKSNDESIDFVLPLAPEDLLIAQPLLKSIEAFASTFKLFIVTTDDGVSMCKQLEFKCQVVCDNELFPTFSLHKLLATWQWQEIIALLSHEIVNTTNYLVLRPDVFFINYATNSLFTSVKKGHFFRILSGIIFSWNVQSSKILNMPVSNWRYNLMPCVLNKMAVRALLSSINQGFTHHSMALIEHLPWKMSSLYFTFLEFTHQIGKYHVEQKLNFVGDTIDSLQDYQEWQVEKCFQKNNNFIFAACDQMLDIDRAQFNKKIFSLIDNAIAI